MSLSPSHPWASDDMVTSARFNFFLKKESCHMKIFLFLVMKSYRYVLPGRKYFRFQIF